MKILQVFDMFSPHGGGTVDLIYHYSKVLVERGHEVTIYASDFKLDQAYIDSLKGVTVRTFRCWANLSGFYLMPGMIGAVRKNLKDFDIIHLHCQRSFQNIVIHHYARKYGVPYVLQPHGSTLRTHGRRGVKHVLKWLFDVFFGNRITRDASKIIVHGEIGIREYEEIGIQSQDRIILIPYLRDLSEFAHLPPPGKFRSRFNLEEKRIVMFLGRIHWIKGLDFLVESFYDLAKLREDVVLVIVGPDDGHRPALDKLIEKLGLSGRVLFSGFLGGEDKLAALVDADVLVQTSIYEYGAAAPYEAVLCNTPIIVSGHTGCGEDVRKMGTGYLAEYGNRNGLRDMIRYVLDNPAEVALKTQKAKEYIEANLSLVNGIEKYERLYAECIEAGKLVREREK